MTLARGPDGPREKIRQGQQNGEVPRESDLLEQVLLNSESIISARSSVAHEYLGASKDGPFRVEVKDSTLRLTFPEHGKDIEETLQSPLNDGEFGWLRRHLSHHNAQIFPTNSSISYYLRRAERYARLHAALYAESPSPLEAGEQLKNFLHHYLGRSYAKDWPPIEMSLKTNQEESAVRFGNLARFAESASKLVEEVTNAKRRGTPSEVAARLEHAKNAVLRQNEADVGRIVLKSIIGEPLEERQPCSFDEIISAAEELSRLRERPVRLDIEVKKSGYTYYSGSLFIERSRGGLLVELSDQRPPREMRSVKALFSELAHRSVNDDGRERWDFEGMPFEDLALRRTT